MTYEKQTYTCISCPLGCRIHITKQRELFEIKGNQCNQGEIYAKQEMTNPCRLLTTTIRIYGGTQNMLPVRSVSEIPKHMIQDCIKIISKIQVKAPVKCGHVIYRNILDTGVDIVASRDMDQEGE